MNSVSRPLRSLSALSIALGLLAATPAAAEKFTMIAVPALAEPMRRLALPFKAATRHEYRLDAASSAGALEAVARDPALALVAIDDAAAADAFIAAGSLTQGQPVAMDRLVLAMPSAHARQIRLHPGAALAGLLDGGSLGLADAMRNGVGKRSQEAIAWLGVGNDASDPPIVRFEHSGDLAAALLRLEVAAALLPASQLSALPAIEIAGIFPASAVAALTYAAYPVAGRAPQAVAAFLAFLDDPASRQILQRAGLALP